MGKRIKTNIKDVKTTTQDEKKEKKTNTSKMENNLRETILETINLVVNKGTETEHVKKMEIDAKKKNIGVNMYSYKLKH